MTTAAGVIIGEEILNGRVRDQNSLVLIKTLREAGVKLTRLAVIGDDANEIGRTVREMSELVDYVVTSGGIGPTHDDCTVQGIAGGFGARVVRHPDLENLLRTRYGNRLNEAALKMADVPEGSRLLADKPYPTIVFRNVYVLPGIPQYFAAEMRLIRNEFRGAPVTSRHIYINNEESQIAAQLHQIVREHPTVSVGSYPHLNAEDYKVLVTLEGMSSDELRLAEDDLRAIVAPGDFVRAEDG